MEDLSYLVKFYAGNLSLYNLSLSLVYNYVICRLKHKKLYHVALTSKLHQICTDSAHQIYMYMHEVIKHIYRSISFK